jgi:hypothetical protein
MQSKSATKDHATASAEFEYNELSTELELTSKIGLGVS